MFSLWKPIKNMQARFGGIKFTLGNQSVSISLESGCPDSRTLFVGMSFKYNKHKSCTFLWTLGELENF